MKVLKNKQFLAHQKSQKISADMMVSEAIARYPDTIPIFMKYGMHCIGCPMAMQETIEQATAGHGIPIDKIIIDLNKAAKKKKI